jgi:hypothetical protein
VLCTLVRLVPAIIVVIAGLCWPTASVAQPLGQFTINYAEATGCPPFEASNIQPTDGNPYHCSHNPIGRIQEYDAAPGTYHLRVIAWSGGWTGAQVWSGDAASGIRYHIDPIAGGLDIHHNFGKLVFFSWDWYSGDNASDYLTVELCAG